MLQVRGAVPRVPPALGLSRPAHTACVDEPNQLQGTVSTVAHRNCATARCSTIALTVDLRHAPNR